MVEPISKDTQKIETAQASQEINAAPPKTKTLLQILFSRIFQGEKSGLSKAPKPLTAHKISITAFFSRIINTIQQRILSILFPVLTKARDDLNTYKAEYNSIKTNNPARPLIEKLKATRELQDALQILEAKCSSSHILKELSSCKSLQIACYGLTVDVVSDINNSLASSYSNLNRLSASKESSERTTELQDIAKDIIKSISEIYENLKDYSKVSMSQTNSKTKTLLSEINSIYEILQNLEDNHSSNPILQEELSTCRELQGKYVTLARQVMKKELSDLATLEPKNLRESTDFYNRLTRLIKKYSSKFSVEEKPATAAELAEITHCRSLQDQYAEHILPLIQDSTKHLSSSLLNSTKDLETIEDLDDLLTSFIELYSSPSQATTDVQITKQIKLADFQKQQNLCAELTYRVSSNVLENLSTSSSNSLEELTTLAKIYQSLATLKTYFTSEHLTLTEETKQTEITKCRELQDLCAKLMLPIINKNFSDFGNFLFSQAYDHLLLDPEERYLFSRKVEAYAEMYNDLTILTEHYSSPSLTADESVTSKEAIECRELQSGCVELIRLAIQEGLQNAAKSHSDGSDVGEMLCGIQTNTKLKTVTNGLEGDQARSGNFQTQFLKDLTRTQYQINGKIITPDSSKTSEANEFPLGQQFLEAIGSQQTGKSDKTSWVADLVQRFLHQGLAANLLKDISPAGSLFGFTVSNTTPDAVLAALNKTLPESTTISFKEGDQDIIVTFSMITTLKTDNPSLRAILDKLYFTLSRTIVIAKDEFEKAATSEEIETLTEKELQSKADAITIKSVTASMSDILQLPA